MVSSIVLFDVCVEVNRPDTSRTGSLDSRRRYLLSGSTRCKYQTTTSHRHTTACGIRESQRIPTKENDFLLQAHHTPRGEHHLCVRARYDLIHCSSDVPDVLFPSKVSPSLQDEYSIGIRKTRFRSFPTNYRSRLGPTQPQPPPPSNSYGLPISVHIQPRGWFHRSHAGGERRG